MLSVILMCCLVSSCGGWEAWTSS